MFELRPEIKSLFTQDVSVFSFEHQKSFLEKDFQAFEQWLSEKAHSHMNFLEKNKDVRKDSNLILKEVKTALVFLFPYAHGAQIRPRLGTPLVQNHIKKNSLIEKKLISKYVYGKDYHKKIKLHLEDAAKKLQHYLTHEIKSESKNTDFKYRAVVDSVPFFDRAHARETGLGFIGKNTMLIRPGTGSYFFIATLLTTLPIEVFALRKKSPPHLDCGTCTKCLDACPTQALEKDFFLNANKCLSYLSIEHRDLVENKYIQYFKDTIYGCDICQDVCPYNFVTLDTHIIPEFAQFHKPFTDISVEQIAVMTPTEYEKWFGGTAATRAKYEGLVRNALYHLSAINHKEIKSLCEQALLKNNILIQRTAKQILKFHQFQSESLSR